MIADNHKNAEKQAIEDFKSRGYYFEEISISSINYMDEIDF